MFVKRGGDMTATRVKPPEECGMLYLANSMAIMSILSGRACHWPYNVT